VAVSIGGIRADTLDLTTFANVCEGGAVDVVMSGQMFGTGEASICTATGSITLGPTASFLDGSQTLLQAPVVEIHPDVDAQQGSVVILGSFAIAPVRKTGQTTCYDSAGGIADCVGSGQDGELQKGVPWPNPRFTVNGDGTVTDNLTGLTWMADPECGPRFEYPNTSWADALTAANAMAAGQCGLSDGSAAGDWRLANVRELASLVHYGFVGPALPNTAGSGQWAEADPFSGVHGLVSGYPTTYWTATSYWTRSDLARCHWVYDGNQDLCSNGSTFGEYVWMVKENTSAPWPAPVPATGQTNSLHAGDDGALQEGLPWPTPRFTDNGDGTVTDNSTALVWLKNADCNGFATSWSNALSKANGLEHGDCGLGDGSTAGDWRLPNILELMSLIDFAHYDPALSNALGDGQWQEGDAFTNVRSSTYWSSTTVTGDSAKAWCVTPKYGYPARFSKSPTTRYYFWAVRDGW
jgi:hypothetical protein